MAHLRLPCSQITSAPVALLHVEIISVKTDKKNVVAVIVTYEPAIPDLSRLLGALTLQVEACIVIDNGSSNGAVAAIQNFCRGNVFLVPLERNYGIAYAQNRGIAKAKELGAEYVLLSDQDSVPAPNMVGTLLSVIEKRISAGDKVACVGPRYLDERQQNPVPFIRIDGLRLKRCSCASENAVVPVDYLIASGCLIPVSVLDRVKGMREDLFIDYVDIEWGLRARRLGFQSYGVCGARMSHSLGDKPIRFMGRQIPLHSPLRHYYHFRNAVLLYRENWIPTNWKLVDGWRLLLKYGFYSMFAVPRVRHWWMMTLGVWHGLRRKSGKLHVK